MGEFADKYDGDVNKALQAITRARLEASEDSFSLDDAVKKRFVCTSIVLRVAFTYDLS